MVVTSLGFDPELGKKFAQESSGFVIGLGKSSRTSSPKSNWPEGSQEWHDEMLAQTQDQSNTVAGTRDTADGMFINTQSNPPSTAASKKRNK